MIILYAFISGCKEKDREPLSPCQQLPDSGPCEAYFPKYYFDQDNAKCKQFIWGGCQGNVPFDTYLACYEACGGTLDSLGKCEMIPDPGPCDAVFSSYRKPKKTIVLLSKFRSDNVVLI